MGNNKCKLGKPGKHISFAHICTILEPVFCIFFELANILKWQFQTGENQNWLTQENKHGQLGLGDFVSSATPKPIASLHSRPVVRVLVRKISISIYIYLHLSLIHSTLVSMATGNKMGPVASYLLTYKTFFCFPRFFDPKTEVSVVVPVIP